MKTCPDTDAIVTIAGALHWDVADGIRHLQSCSECREQIQLLAATHTTLTAEEHVDEATLARITSALAVEARTEQTATRKTQRRIRAFEVSLAAIAAPVALVSSGVSADSAALLGAAIMGAALLVLGVRLRPYAQEGSTATTRTDG